MPERLPPARLAALALATAFGAGALSVGADLGASPEPDPDRVQMRLQADEHALGSAGAPLTVVEFTDYQCPYCRRFQAQTWPRLKRDYVDTGKVRFIVRDLPLEFHLSARPAAAAAHCAGEQGKFWAMHAVLLAGTADLGAGGIERRARAIGLDMARLHACVASGKYAFAIARNAAEADALGLSGTPSFIIGRAVHGELTGERVAGALPYQDFDALLRELLAGN
ncbi:MAG: DsbA family protein [Steroidobacteraceae bacterium]